MVNKVILIFIILIAVYLLVNAAFCIGEAYGYEHGYKDGFFIAKNFYKSLK